MTISQQARDLRRRDPRMTTRQIADALCTDPRAVRQAVKRQPRNRCERDGYVDPVGRRFGWYTVLHVTAGPSAHRYLGCRCDCGAVRVVREDRIVSGRRKSCGCGGRVARGDG